MRFNSRHCRCIYACIHVYVCIGTYIILMNAHIVVLYVRMSMCTGPCIFVTYYVYPDATCNKNHAHVRTYVHMYVPLV